MVNKKFLFKFELDDPQRVHLLTAAEVINQRLLDLPIYEESVLLPHLLYIFGIV
jgi:hypothetical protein